MNAGDHRKRLIELLSDERHYWFERKESIDSHDNADYYQELKAKYRILGEAISLIEKLDLSRVRNGKQFKEMIKKAVEKDSLEWGWGSNWSDDAQNSAVRVTKNLIAEYLGKIS